MDTNSLDLLRRSLRAAVFRTERLRLAGRVVEADEQIAGELAATVARLATLGEPDPAETARRWHNEDLGSFDFAQLLGELVAEQVAGTRLAGPLPEGPTPRRDGPPPPPPAAIPQHAFPPPQTGIPGLADLLDDMLSQDRRHRAQPRS